MKTQPIPLSRLERHTQNARDHTAYRKADLKDLVTSIREHGLLQPLVVSKDGEGYTILAGHRRHAALKQLKAKEAPCVVLDPEDDQAALAVLVTENAQHRAVDPLREAEAVAQLVAGFLEEKHPHDRAAAVLGRSAAWVRGRLRLTTLSPSWRKAFADRDSPISQFPIGHIEVIAALSAEVQERAVQEWGDWWDEGVPLREDIKRMVAELTCDLAEVPWDSNDAEILPDAPACSTCPRRDSVQGDLFGDLGGVHGTKGDRCMDATCFEAKRRAAIYATVEAARTKYGDDLHVETTLAHRDIPMPEDVKVHQEHELTPLVPFFFTGVSCL